MKNVVTSQIFIVTHINEITYIYNAYVAVSTVEYAHKILQEGKSPDRLLLPYSRLIYSFGINYYSVGTILIDTLRRIQWLLCYIYFSFPFL